MGGLGLFFGTERLIVGIEDDREDPTLLRVYIDSRGLCRYILVADPEQQELVRRAWRSSQHLTMPSPDGYYVDEEQVAAIAARNAAETEFWRTTSGLTSPCDADPASSP